MIRIALISLGVAGSLLACNSNEIVVGGLDDTTILRAIPNRDLDILFVVDNSPSMSDKQVSLAENFPRMMDVLGQLDGGLPNLHIGVITSDMGTQSSGSPNPGPGIGVVGNGGCAGLGDDGRLQHANAPELTGNFISDVEDGSGGRVRDYTGQLRDVFTHIALVGAGGCGFEQHLASMRRSFANTANLGFLRPTANLAVVILADEDDCSMLDSRLMGPDQALGPLQSFRCFDQGVKCDGDDPRSPGSKSNCGPRNPATFVEGIDPFIDALHGVKADVRQIMVAAIAGDPSPVAVELAPPPGGGTPIPMLSHSCEFGGPDGPEVADPAVRIAAFVGAFHNLGQLTSVCSNDLSGSLTTIGGTAKRLIGDPCLDTAKLADVAPDPGVQPACEVTDVRDSDPNDPTTLPVCTAGLLDCYELVPDPTVCPATDDHLRIRVIRSQPASADTWTHVRCQRAS